MKIGYQGEVYSNCYFATKKFSEIINVEGVDLIPCVTSENVLKELKSKEIDYGVVAYKNNIGGIVSETKEILKKTIIEIISRLEMIIHHWLFVKSEKSFHYISKIISHEQAIKQCKNYLNKNYKYVKLIKGIDTAFCAKELNNGKISSDTAVICNKKAGLNNNLFLVDENIEDALSVTEFLLIKLK